MMQHIEVSKTGDAIEALEEHSLSPFEDPGSPQFGIVPGDAEPPGEHMPQASAPPAPQAAAEMVGTPAELWPRNLQNNPPMSVPSSHASTMPLGFSPTHPADRLQQ